MDQPRQLILESAAGIAGNGIATIGGDNSFSIIAHLPQPNVLSAAPSVYAVYLVDAKGSNGFCAGTLSSAGSGMYQLRFRSQVPLVHYDKVIISLENPQAVMHYPQGPVLLQVKPGFLAGMGIGGIGALGGLAFLEPLKKVSGTVFGKAAGFVKDRAGGILKHKQEPDQMTNQIQDQYTGNQIQAPEQINNQGPNQNLNQNQIPYQNQYQYQGRNQYRNPYQKYQCNQYQYQNQRPYQNQNAYQNQVKFSGNSKYNLRCSRFKGRNISKINTYSLIICKVCHKLYRQYATKYSTESTTNK
jgi:hypothetical protein